MGIIKVDQNFRKIVPSSREFTVCLNGSHFIETKPMASVDDTDLFVNFQYQAYPHPIIGY